MNWKWRLALLWLLAIPAFTGFPVDSVPGVVVSGVGLGWLVYALAVHVAVVLLLGKKTYRIAILMTLAITIPVVILGIVISFAGLLISGWSHTQQTIYMAHYTGLAVTMVTVIPLALSMVAVIPMHRLEHHLLQRPGGVAIAEKIALMALRVFSHTIYYVLPNILEVIREEGLLPTKDARAKANLDHPAPSQGRGAWLLRMIIHVAVDAICASLRYIPFWAEEIAKLPGKTSAMGERDDADSRIEEKKKDGP